MDLSFFKDVNFWFELLAFLVSVVIVVSGKAKNTPFVSLPIYLGYIIAFDIGLDFLENDRFLSGQITNRVIIPTEVLYMQLLGIVLLQSKKLKKISFIFIYCYLIFFIIDWIQVDLKHKGLYIRSYTAGVVGIVAVTSMLYYELLNSKKLLSFFKQPVFWFYTGVLIFYLGTLPIHIYWNLATQADAANALKGTQYIFDLLMNIMYLFFAISMLSLLWEKK